MMVFSIVVKYLPRLKRRAVLRTGVAVEIDAPLVYVGELVFSGTESLETAALGRSGSAPCGGPR